MRQTYVFDFDGTLVDTMDVVVKVLLDFLHKRGIAYPENILKTISPLGYKGIAEYYVKEFSLSESPQEVYATLFNEVSDAYKNDFKAKPMADYVLRKLVSQGYSLNILTASPRELVAPCVKRLGWEKLFDNIFTTEDFRLNKSEPYVFIETAKALGRNAEDCLMIDDSLNALLNAKKAGMKTIGVYDVHSAKDELKMRASVDKYILLLDELL